MILDSISSRFTMLQKGVFYFIALRKNLKHLKSTERTLPGVSTCNSLLRGVRVRIRHDRSMHNSCDATILTHIRTQNANKQKPKVLNGCLLCPVFGELRETNFRPITGSRPRDERYKYMRYQFFYFRSFLFANGIT